MGQPIADVVGKLGMGVYLGDGPQTFIVHTGASPILGKRRKVFILLLLFRPICVRTRSYNENQELP